MSVVVYAVLAYGRGTNVGCLEFFHHIVEFESVKLDSIVLKQVCCVITQFIV